MKIALLVVAFVLVLVWGAWVFFGTGDMSGEEGAVFRRITDIVMVLLILSVVVMSGVMKNRYENDKAEEELNQKIENQDRLNDELQAEIDALKQPAESIEVPENAIDNSKPLQDLVDKLKGTTDEETGDDSQVTDSGAVKEDETAGGENTVTETDTKEETDANEETGEDNSEVQINVSPSNEDTPADGGNSVIQILQDDVAEDA